MAINPKQHRPVKQATIRPGDAPGPPRVKVLTDEDLEDPDRYIKLESIPLLDVHNSSEKGNVGEDLLKLIAHNSNARANRGDYAPVLLGHTVDGEDYEEHRQPPTVGFSRNFHIKLFRGRPCLHADFHIHKDRYGVIPTYPNRSVERMKSETDPGTNWIDAVSLLRKAPERDLGRLGYDRSMPEGAVMVRYARNLGGLPGPMTVLAAFSSRRVRMARRDMIDRLERYSRPYDCGKGKGGRFEARNICASKAKTAAQAESHVRTKKLVESVRAKTGRKRPVKPHKTKISAETVPVQSAPVPTPIQANLQSTSETKTVTGPGTYPVEPAYVRKDADKLFARLNKHLSMEIAIHRKKMIIDEQLRGEPPAIVTATARRLKSADPELFQAFLDKPHSPYSPVNEAYRKAADVMPQSVPIQSAPVPTPIQANLQSASVMEQATEHRAKKGDYNARAAQLAEKAKQKAESIYVRGRALNERLREMHSAANRARKPERIAKLKAESERFYEEHKPKATELLSRIDKLYGISERATKEPGYRRAEARGFTRQQADTRKAEALLLKTLRKPIRDSYEGDKSRFHREKIREAFPHLASKVDQSRIRRDKLSLERRKVSEEQKRARETEALLAARRRYRELRRQDLTESIVDEAGRPSTKNQVVADPGRFRRMLDEARSRRSESIQKRSARKMATAKIDTETLMDDAKYYLRIAKISEGAERDRYLDEFRKARRLALETPFSQKRISEQSTKARAHDIRRFGLFGGKTPTEIPHEPRIRHSRMILSSALSRYIRS